MRTSWIFHDVSLDSRSFGGDEASKRRRFHDGLKGIVACKRSIRSFLSFLFIASVLDLAESGSVVIVSCAEYRLDVSEKHNVRNVTLQV